MVLTTEAADPYKTTSQPRPWRKACHAISKTKPRLFTAPSHFINKNVEGARFCLLFRCFLDTTRLINFGGLPCSDFIYAFCFYRSEHVKLIQKTDHIFQAHIYSLMSLVAGSRFARTLMPCSWQLAPPPPLPLLHVRTIQ